MNEVKSILIIAKYAATKKEGFETRTTELAYQFAKNNISTTVISSNSNHLATFPKYKNTFNPDKHNGVDFWWLKCIQYKNSSSWKRIVSWIEFEVKAILLSFRLDRHDIIIATSLSLLSILSGLFYKIKWGSKLVFEIRDIWPLTLTEDGDFSKFNPFIILMSSLEKLGYYSSDSIVGTMPNLKAHVKNVTSEKCSKKVGCIPFGIHKKKISQTKQPIIPNIILENREKFKVGYAGSIGVSNALDNLIESIAILDGSDKRIHFFILGDGALIEDYKFRLKNCNNVSFIGKVPRENVSNYLEGMDLLFFSAKPNEIWKYGWSPNKLIDYMLAKKPILAAYDGYQSMINEANCGYFIKSGSTYSLLEAFKKISNLPQSELEKLGYNGFEWLVTNRDWNNLGNQYLLLLKNI